MVHGMKVELTCSHCDCMQIALTFLILRVLLVSVLISVMWNKNYLEHIQKLEVYCNKPMTF
jgi:hypothetical protein